MSICAICDKCDRKSYLTKVEVWRFMDGSLPGWRLGKDGYTGEDVCENCQQGIDPDREAALDAAREEVGR